MKNKSFYITTTLPYANAKPHIGFAMEAIRADTIARFKRLMGYEVFFNTGTDEHGMKIHQKAMKEGKDTQQFLDDLIVHFKALEDKLNLSYDRFIRTTDEDHKKAVKEFWKICDEKGYIYKKQYKGLYCIGCEMYVTEKDLINGECPNHPGSQPEEIEEENYFFKYSEFSKDLLKVYKKKDFVIPEHRLKEVSNFVGRGLEDFSISRLKEKMPWGISVPGDENHVVYVWFDALINYISTLGWPDEVGNFKKFWRKGETVQYCGKDNLQQQAARWQAMLIAAGLPTTNTVIINGFITADGQKMSKSLGNVIDPADVVKEYGTDAFRYYMLRELSPFEDGSFTMEKFKEAYNANLANGIGNAVSRVMKMAEDNLESPIKEPKKEKFPKEYLKAFEEYNLQKASEIVWEKISKIDARIQETQPFKLVKEDRKAAQKIIQELVMNLYSVAILLQPFLPETSDKIKEAILQNKKPEPLFLRKD